MPQVEVIAKPRRRLSWACHGKKLCRAAAGQAWRVAVFVVGITLLALGVVLVPLPGPGMLVVVLGLGILSVEFAWARGGLAKLRDLAAQLRTRLRELLASSTTRNRP